MEEFVNEEEYAYTLEPYMYFDTYADVYEAIERYSRQESFYLTRNTANFPKPRAMELFGVPNVMQRGRYYCNYKSKEDKSNRSKKTSCTFIVAFSYDLKRRKYVLRDYPFELKHNHVIGDRSTAQNPPRTVSLERDLSKEEYRDIMRYSPYYGVAQIREILRPRHPDRDYSAALMSRLLKKGKQLFYEKDMKDHPMYDPNERVVRLPAPEEPGSLQVKLTRNQALTSTLGSSLISYNQVAFPAGDFTRYTKLRERSDRLILQAINNEHLYKLFMLTLKDLQSQFNEEKSLEYADFEHAAAAAASEHHHDHLLSETLGKRTQPEGATDLEEEHDAKRSDKGCSDCKRHGITAIDHRAKSSKCPYIEIAQI